MAQKRIMIEEFAAWQKPVLAIANSGTATKGFRYIVGSIPTGTFDGLTPNHIAWYNGTEWLTDTPQEGWVVYDKNQGKYLQFSGTAWEDHGADVDISGKADKVTGAVDGNLAGLDSNGNLTDSGVAITDVEDAITNSHVQNTDQFLDEGGANEVSAAQAKEAYDKRGVYDADLGCILMDL